MFCSSRLCSVDCVKCLIEEEPYRPGEVHPWGAILVKGRVVVEESEEVYDHEAETAEGDLWLRLGNVRAVGSIYAYSIRSVHGVSRGTRTDVDRTHAMDMGKNLIATLV